MLKAATADEMRGIDTRTIKSFGLSGNVLMERAGGAVSDFIKREYPGKRVVALCGSGNNGGDGIVAARELHNAGIKVRAILTSADGNASPELKKQLNIAKKFGVEINNSSLNSADLHGSVVIDAVFGTGLARAVKGPLKNTFELINKSSAPVISVDIPSGISADTGAILGAAIRADHTVTFGCLKRGHLLHPGAEHSGEISIADIGFPKGLFDAVKCNVMEMPDAALMMPQRPRDSHKGDYGHVLLIAGSTGKTGAAMMAAKSCLRAGAGLVTIAAPESIAPALYGMVKEEMVLPLKESKNGGMSMDAIESVLGFLDERADVLAMGPGMGRNPKTGEFVRETIKRSTVPMVADADAIYALKNSNKSFYDRLRAPLTLTPHHGEFAWISGMGKNSASLDKINAAMSFAKQTGCYLILKGAPTLMAGPEGDCFINPTGNPGLAKAGSGDVLTGIIAAFLGQGIDPLRSSALAAYAHGLAADIAAADKTEHSLLATDVIESLPKAFKSITGALS